MNDFSTQLWLADTDVLKDPELFTSAYEMVSPERQAKIDRFRFPEDQRLSLGAALLLRKVLKGIGLPTADLHFEIGPFGKPCLPAFPDVFFNLSHSGHYVLCAVSDHEVGCDIEKIQERDMKLAKRFFTAGEYEQICARPTAAEQNQWFYRIWTLKESVMKATGFGMHLPLNAFDIVLNEAGCDPQLSMSKANEDLYFKDTERISLKEFQVPGYSCALCLTGGCEKVYFQTDQLIGSEER